MLPIPSLPLFYTADFYLAYIYNRQATEVKKEDYMQTLHSHVHVLWCRSLKEKKQLDDAVNEYSVEQHIYKFQVVASTACMKNLEPCLHHSDHTTTRSYGRWQAGRQTGRSKFCLFI